MSREGVTCCGSWPTGYEKRTLNVFGSMTEIVFPIEFGTYTRSGIDCSRGKMPPVAAAYTFTPAGELFGAGGFDRDDDEDGDDEDFDALVGVALPIVQAVPIMPSANMIAPARNQKGVLRGFIGRKHTGRPRRPM